MRRNPKDTTVAVLMGGWSAERDVSLSSGEACSNALRRSGFNVVQIDVKRETIISVLQELKPDVVFNKIRPYPDVVIAGWYAPHNKRLYQLCVNELNMVEVPAWLSAHGDSPRNAS